LKTESFKVKLTLPSQAAAETDATILAWKVSEGVAFKKTSILAEAESAKAAFTFEAPCDGTVVRLLHKEGEIVSFDEPVIEIETADQAMLRSTAAVEAKVHETKMLVLDPVSGPEPVEGEIGILGLGGYVPERIVKTAELVRDFPDITEEYIVGVTGINQRHWAHPDEKPSDLALHAARQAIAKAGMSARDIDAIVVTTTTPDVVMPATACILQDKLGTRGIPAFDLNAACSGWLYGLVVARGLIQTGVGSHVLVVGVDMQSRLIDKQDKGTYFLFGDGAGAAIVSSASGAHPLRQHILKADAKGINMARRDLPGYEVPHNSGAGADPWIRLDGHALFRFATESFATFIHNVIEKSGWRHEDIRWVVPHQANGRILKAAAKKSGVSFDRFYVNVDRYGNTSSASIPLALLEIEKGLQKGDKLVMASVGAGVTAAAVSVQW
jgi:3-oxoacyl-[acyl-carrier-protein] synthase-3